MPDRITDALRGQTSPPGAPMPTPTPLDSATGGEPGDGTVSSGYVTPDLGPFECENCIHFEAPGSCNHPTVVSDPEVQGNVDPEGCCNFFKSAHSESQEEEHSEGGF